MNDILIVKYRDRAEVFGISDKGKRWLKKNVEQNAMSHYTLDSDLVIEIVVNLEAAGLVVEVK